MRTSNREAEVKPRGPGAKADLPIASEMPERPMCDEDLTETVCARDNLRAALKRVRQNQGSPRVDGMTVEELPGYLKEHWLAIKELLLQGEYCPRAVKRVEIPKPGKGAEKRKLGIPCVLDRFIQQAVLQVLQARWDRSFSESSFGFRPGRSGHRAIAVAQSYMRPGQPRK
ncbi:MAG: reverse transcriptase domain-containing protein [Gammaproteobacteria bacterium]